MEFNDKYPNPAKMNHSVVSLIPVNYDFGSNEFGNDWEEVEVLECEECHEQMVSSFTYNGEKHCNYDDFGGGDAPDCEGTLVGSDGPMMNYFYPLPGLDLKDAYEAAKKIDGLNLCIIWFPMEEKCGMALTGAGMDFSWEICEAYMQLGFVPPYHFASDMDSDASGMTEVREWVIEGCRESIDTVLVRAKSALTRLDMTEKLLRERTK